jgi:hypothetical protein
MRGARRAARGACHVEEDARCVVLTLALARHLDEIEGERREI